MAWSKTIKEHCSIMFYSVLFFWSIVCPFPFSWTVKCIVFGRWGSALKAVWNGFDIRVDVAADATIWFILDPYFVKRDTELLWKKEENIDLSLCWAGFCFPMSFFLSFHGWLSSKCQRCFVMALSNHLKGYAKLHNEKQIEHVSRQLCRELQPPLFPNNLISFM